MLHYGRVISSSRGGGFCLALTHGHGSRTRVFLHRDNGCDVEVVNNRAVFREGNRGRIALPAVGDSVAFYMRPSERGFEATEWTYASWWKAAERRTRKHSIWRICKLHVGNASGILHYKTIWEGDNIMAMSVRFPRVDGVEAYDSLSGKKYEIQHWDGAKWLLVHKDPRKWICCVPRSEYLKHGDREQSQPPCTHGKETPKSSLRS